MSLDEYLSVQMFTSKHRDGYYIGIFDSKTDKEIGRYEVEV